MLSIKRVVEGLAFPEGPVWLDDDSFVVSEIAKRRVSLVRDGAIERSFAIGGTPAGLARGPDGGIFICVTGGTSFRRDGDLTVPHGPHEEGSPARIDRLDLDTGAVVTLYEGCEGVPLSSPNDLVFDAFGGFYFTDLGRTTPRWREHGAVYYAKSDGTGIRRVIHPLITPNGIGLSPDGRSLLVAETIPGRLWRFPIAAPGEVRTRESRFAAGDLVAGVGGLQCLDSLAVQADGAACIGTLYNGGVTRISADGARIEHLPFDDQFTTNICFGGAGMTSALVTLSSTGRVVECAWDAPGLRLAFQD